MSTLISFGFKMWMINDAFSFYVIIAWILIINLIFLAPQLFYEATCLENLFIRLDNVKPSTLSLTLSLFHSFFCKSWKISKKVIFLPIQRVFLFRAAPFHSVISCIHCGLLNFSYQQNEAKLKREIMNIKSFIITPEHLMAYTHTSVYLMT